MAITVETETPPAKPGEQVDSRRAWAVLASAIGTNALLGTLLYQSFGAYLVLLQAEFGWGKTLLSAAYSIQQAESGLLAPVQGWLIGRYGVQRVIRFGLIIAAAGFFMFSRTESIETFFLSFIVISIGASLAGQLSLTTLLVAWFDKRRTTALSFLNTGVSASGFLVPIVAIVLTALGWRATALLSCALFLAVGIPLSFVLRERRDVDAVPSAAVSGASDSGPEFTFKQAIRTRTFWLISFGHAFGASLYAAVSVHLVSAVIGMLHTSLESAALVVSLATGMNVAGQLAGGVFGDRFDKRRLIILCVSGMIAGFTFLTLADSLWMIVAFAVLYGVSIGARGPLIVSLRAEYFGRKSFAQVFGLSMTIVTLLTMLGPLLVGALADAFGSYRPGFALMTGFAVASLVCFLLVSKPAHPGIAGHATG